MLVKLVYTFSLLSCLVQFSQAQEKYEKFIIDTVFLGTDSVVLYSDKSWEYLKMVNFNGALTIELDSLTKFLGFKENWDIHVPYTYDNDPTTIKDTLWLCNLVEGHGGFSMPHPGLVTSTFKYRNKRFHYGIDVDLETGDTLVSTFDGIVRYAKFNSSGFGNLVIIRHYNGLETYYAHLSKLLVVPNQEVKAGDVIGLGGKTGRAYGDHLHYEVRFYGNAINPEIIIDFDKKELRDENLFIHAGMFDYNKKKVSSKSNSSSKKITPVDVKKGTVHTIKQGDTLYGLAIKYKTTVNKICELNGISKTKILHTGDKIIVK